MIDTKQLRVIGIPWHTAHQYELAKMFKQYDLMMNIYREWGSSSRPMPENMKEVISFDPKDYDLAILHIDQQCIDPRIGKGLLVKEFKELTKGMKRVLINHMTPFHDKYTTDEVIVKIKEIVGDIPMITNSKQAARQWGWGTPIIHGLDIDEWQDLPKEPRAVASISTGGMDEAYRRHLLHVTIEILKEKGLDLVWIQATKKFTTFEAYKEYIGRSLVFVHLAWQSPMPRARTEAMLSGACVVTTRHHDIDEYIEDGVNGFIVPDNPTTAARIIEELLTTKIKEAREIGQRGKLMAREKFNHERWANDWANYLTEVFEGRITK